MMTADGFITALQQLTLWILPLVVSFTLHEAGHAYAAWKLGDNTALAMGRLSLNPAKHIDPMGTIGLPVILALTGAPFMFGWAKPVPVNIRQLRQTRWAMPLVAAAGPATNVVLALLAGLLWHAVDGLPNGAMGDFIAGNIANLLLINVTLFLFNMIPLPPLDGSKVLMGFLPRPWVMPYELYGGKIARILFIIIIVGPLLGSLARVHFDPFGWLMLPALRGMASFMMMLTGN